MNRTSKNEDDLKNGDDLKNENNLKNEDNLKNEVNLKNNSKIKITLFWRLCRATAYTTLVVLVVSTLLH